MRESFQVGRPIPPRYRVGPLGSYMDQLAARLSEYQYGRQRVRHKLRVVADLSRWLERRRIGIKNLDDRTIARFFHRRHRYNPVRAGDVAAIRWLLKLLRELGVLPGEPSREDSVPRHATEISFEQYLRQERCLSQATVLIVLPFVRRFLTDRFGVAAIRLADIRHSDITQFILRHAHVHSPKRAKLLVYALRSYFRFLYLRGESAADLSAAVPTVAEWRMSDVPKSIEPEQVEHLLKICSRRVDMGRLRDYAILLLLARLGLRAGEIRALTLEDIHWEAGEITVHGKGSRCDLLPIPSDVGEALAAYLRNGRPPCTTRRVFLTVRAPARELSAVSCVVRRALARAGIQSGHKGAHLLRHSLAVRMLRKGASLADIGEVLRHRQMDTTAIYAKVDLTALRTLAQPWPGGET